jgi:uncharacterized protein GlcG (DUF336 family)
MMAATFDRPSVTTALARAMIEAAERKAADFVKDDPPLAMGAATGIDRLIVFGGGYPVKVGDAVVGAIGVSGGHYRQDMEVAQAGLSALAAF